MSLESAGTEAELVRSVTFPAADLQTGNEVNVQRQIATVGVERWGCGCTFVNVHLVNTFLYNTLYTLLETVLCVLKHLKQN